jgi:hypothetical protein
LALFMRPAPHPTPQAAVVGVGLGVHALRIAIVERSRTLARTIDALAPSLASVSARCWVPSTGATAWPPTRTATLQGPRTRRTRLATAGAGQLRLDLRRVLRTPCAVSWTRGPILGNGADIAGAFIRGAAVCLCAGCTGRGGVRLRVCRPLRTQRTAKATACYLFAHLVAELRRLREAEGQRFRGPGLRDSVEATGAPIVDPESARKN